MADMEFNEVVQPGQEVFDYARCQRPNGTFYGTSGQCRKGTPAGAKEKPEKKPRAKKKDVAKVEKTAAKKPGSFERGGTLRDSDISNLGGNNSYGKNVPIYEAQIKKATEALKKDPKDEFAQFQLDNATKRLKKYEDSKKVLDSIVANSPKGTEVYIGQNGGIRTRYTTPNGNEVSTDLHRGSFNFQVNKGYDVGTVTQGRAEELAVARQVQRVWSATMNGLPKGYVIGTSAYEEDGRGASRQRAYERMGFSKGQPGDSIYARWNGSKMVPSNQSEEGLSSTLLMFAEKKESDLALWYVAIFGVPNEKEDFSENDTFDFVRCQRPNGTYYGTSGTCRKGAQVGAKEKAALKKAAKAGNQKAKVALAVVEGKMTKAEAKKELGGGGEAKAAPAPKTKEQPKKVEPAPAPKPKAESKSEAKPAKKEGYEPKGKPEEKKRNVLQRAKDKVTGRGKKSDISDVGFKSEGEIKTAFDKRRMMLLQMENVAARKKALAQVDKSEANALRTHRANKEFAANLKKELPSNVKTSIDQDNGAINMSSKVGKNKIDATFSPQTGWNYQVNGGYDTGSVKSRKQQVQIAQQVRQMYDATVRSLPEGAIIRTSAYSQDGGGARRQKAYERLGFRLDKVSEEMFAIKKDGRMVGSLPIEANNNSNVINFAEENLDDIWMDIVFPIRKDAKD